MKSILLALGVSSSTGALVSSHVEMYKGDCGKRVPAFGLVQKEKNPGAGMKPDDIEPFQTVLKDGFMFAVCAKDAMYESGDKFGNNKFSYKMGPVANSSIVHYDEHIPKEDRKKMTPKVCFMFCRGIPDMGFFGISNGRDCYCTPFFKVMASDSSKCDSVCEGDTTKMCGGKSKNTIYSMHLCDQMEEDLEKGIKAGESLEKDLDDTCDAQKKAAEKTVAAAQKMQKAFGNAGDPGAGGLMQQANVAAGKWLHDADDCLDFAARVKVHFDDAKTHKGKDMQDFKIREAAESSLDKLNKLATEGAGVLESHKNWAKAHPQEGKASQLDQYESIMYFVDKKYKDVPVTCEGDIVDEPIYGTDAAHCANACDAAVGKCVGFAAVEYKKNDVICFLFSKFKNVQYYTGNCKKSLDVQPMCRAKLSKFEGTNLTPDETGKNKFVLRELTKANRCVE